MRLNSLQVRDSICQVVIRDISPPPEAKVKSNICPLRSPLPDAPCSDLQGLLSGLLPDAQISVSSSRDMVWSPGTARLVASRSGWFPGPPQPIAGEEWLQVQRQ